MSEEKFHCHIPIVFSLIPFMLDSSWRAIYAYLCGAMTLPQVSQRQTCQIVFPHTSDIRIPPRSGKKEQEGRQWLTKTYQEKQRTQYHAGIVLVR